MVKLLFLVATLFFHDPMTGDAYSTHDIHQIVGESCDEAKADYARDLEATYLERHIVGAEYSCELVEVDPEKNQNGTV